MFRESDWLFSTAKGRKILRKECGVSRVIVIGLFRDQIYESTDHIQIELNDLILSLKPAYCINNKVFFAKQYINSLDNTITLLDQLSFSRSG